MTQRRSPTLRSVSRLLIAAGLAAIPAIAHAGDWTTSQQVGEVVIDDGFTTVIMPGVDNPMGCGTPSFLRVGKTDSNYESMTAAILSAQAQGKSVRLYVAACNSDSSVRFQGVWIQQ